MIPPWDHSEFYRKLDEGVEIAHELGTPRIVVGSGTGFGGWKRQTQLDELIEIYQKAIAQIDGSGVTLVLEPVNVRVDHPGSLLDRTSEAVYVARGVDSPFFGVLYDLYHSTVEGEDVAAELANAGDPLKYVQIADHPGRGEPGTGAIDWAGAARRPARVRLRRTRSASSTTRRRRVGRVGEAHPASWRPAHDRTDTTRTPSTSSSSAAVPTGAAYARILSEEAPSATIAMFEVGPDRVGPARFAREEHRRCRRRAPTRSAAPRGRATGCTDRRLAGSREGGRAARPPRHLPAATTATASTARTACPSPRCRATSAAWPRTGPRPARTPVAASASTSSPDLDELLDEAERLLGVTRDAFDGSPFADLRARAPRRGRRRRARSPPTRVQRMPLAVHRRDDGALVWSGSDVVLGDETRPNPNFDAVRRVARHPRDLVEAVRRGRRRGARPAHGRVARGVGRAWSWSSRPTRCARRSCSGPAASGPTRSGACSTTSRRWSSRPRLRDVLARRRRASPRPARSASRAA